LSLLRFPRRLGCPFGGPALAHCLGEAFFAFWSEASFRCCPFPLWPLSARTAGTGNPAQRSDGLIEGCPLLFEISNDLVYVGQ
jgi:hypothetical protein